MKKFLKQKGDKSHKKKRKIFNLKTIRSKIVFGFTVVIVLVAIVGISTSLILKTMQNNTKHMINEQLTILLGEEKLQSNILERISLSRGYVLFGYPSYKERFEELTEESKKLEQEIFEMNESADLDYLISQSKELETYVQENIFAVYDQGDVSKAANNLSNVNSISERITNGYSELLQKQEDAIVNNGKGLVTLANVALTIGLAIISLVIILSIIIANVTSNRISKPIKRVVDRMMLIANGDVSQSAMENNDSGEIGQLVFATNQMNENLKELLGKIKSASSSVSDQSNSLTIATDELTESSNQIAMTMYDLSAGAETQANHASQLASSMVSFSNKIFEANESGENIHANSQAILSLTKDGSNAMELSIRQMEEIHEIVRDAVQKVEGLDKQSAEITTLVGVINDIADQTNLLALNAAIEAARAGEHGKGFAVVADEVRKLAEQVSLSVTNITEIVSNIQKETDAVTQSLKGGYREVEEGRDQVINTGKTFEQIHDSITNMVKEITTVSQNLSSIASKSDEMNDSIKEIASISEESAAGIEQTSASIQQSASVMDKVSESANQLSSLTETLNELVSRFKLKE